MSVELPGAPAEPRGAFHHGAVSRFNAWFFTAFDRYINHISREHKRAAFDGLRGARVLEIGAGVGANIAHLPPGAELVAVEPSLAMHDALRERCERAGIPLTLHAAGAESIPLPDDSVDEVVCSLVLCTVADPGQVLAEVRRVLRPGGTFRFVEHVAAPPRSVRRVVQRAIQGPWGWLFEGCQLARETPRLVHEAGFTEVHVRQLTLRHSLFYPVNSAVWGIARA